jgi:hypothetical protein
VEAGGAIDYLDIVKNNRLLKRFSQCDTNGSMSDPSIIKTKLFLEVGWGHRDEKTEWDIDFGVSEGRVIGVEPRFRGHLVLSPLDPSRDIEDTYFSSWKTVNERLIHFETKTWGNPNPYTNTSQGMCLEVEAPTRADVLLKTNGRNHRVPIERLMKGSTTGYISDEIESAAWNLHRAPRFEEYSWRINWIDDAPAEKDERNASRIPGQDNRYNRRPGDVYYLRIRQRNGQWGFSSPIKVLY